MNCPTCSVPIQAADKFCQSCGQRLTKAIPVWQLALGGVLIWAFFIWFLWVLYRFTP